MVEVGRCIATISLIDQKEAGQVHDEVINEDQNFKLARSNGLTFEIEYDTDCHNRVFCCEHDVGDINVEVHVEDLVPVPDYEIPFEALGVICKPKLIIHHSEVGICQSALIRIESWMLLLTHLLVGMVRAVNMNSW